MTARLRPRLVEAGDERYAISYWAADGRRLRHLEAVANPFEPRRARPAPAADGRARGESPA